MTSSLQLPTRTPRAAILKPDSSVMPSLVGFSQAEQRQNIGKAWVRRRAPNQVISGKRPGNQTLLAQIRQSEQALKLLLVLAMITCGLLGLNPQNLCAAMATPEPTKKVLAWRDDGSAEVRTVAVPMQAGFPTSYVDQIIADRKLTRPQTEYLLIRRLGSITDKPYALIAYRMQADGPITITGILLKGPTATRVEASCSIAEYGPTLLAIMDIATR